MILKSIPIRLRLTPLASSRPTDTYHKGTPENWFSVSEEGDCPLPQ